MEATVDTKSKSPFETERVVLDGAPALLHSLSVVDDENLPPILALMQDAQGEVCRMTGALPTEVMVAGSPDTIEALSEVVSAHFHFPRPTDEDGFVVVNEVFGSPIRSRDDVSPRQTLFFYVDGNKLFGLLSLRDLRWRHFEGINSVPPVSKAYH